MTNKQKEILIGFFTNPKSLVVFIFSRFLTRFISNDEAYLLRAYFKGLISRPSCHSCHFRTLHRQSDFTIFDCWDAPSVSSKFNKNGATNVFIHTDHGKKVFDIIK